MSRRRVVITGVGAICGLGNDAAGNPPGHGQRPRSADAGEHRRRIGRWLIELHVVEVDLTAVHRDPLAGEQARHRHDDLLERGHRRGRPRAHLRHPRLHAVTDAGQDPAGRQPAQRGDLHRRDGRVARHGREDAQPDPQLLGGGQGGGGQRHAGGVEAVLDHP